jgi:hypothetical protein
MKGPQLTRRHLLGAGAGAGAALALGRARPVFAGGRWTERIDFSSLDPGAGWPGWRCVGVANLRRENGSGLLEAGSDVFPCDPRPVAFALDRRFRDGEISAVLSSPGAGGGVVLRRTGPRDYYAAVYDDERRALVVVRRFPEGVRELGSASVVPHDGPLRLSLNATGARAALLEATIEWGGTPTRVAARDEEAPLSRAGDPGVLATARTLFPHEGPPVAPALGNLHLLPYGVQEGEAFMETAVGEEVMSAIRERSTAVFVEISFGSSERSRTTRPSVVAATTGAPLGRGATLRVATDVSAGVEIELASGPDFRRARRVRVGRADSFQAVLASVRGLPPGRRVYWRPRLRRRGRVTVGPTRSFRVLPRAGTDGRATVAIGSCASQFGPAFDELAKRDPDVFVWQGDLNYPDTVGPLAQTTPGYSGIWRDFLANPRMAPLFERTMFGVQRDDHDYGLQDANSTNLVPWGLGPWEALMERRPCYRFSAGHADVWVLDQRLNKSDPSAQDTEAKTLLGKRQRAWLLRTLAASRAAFKVVCSPCTLAPLAANERDGSWAAGFTAERDLLLDHIRKNVDGQTLFVTGDTHWTMVYDRDGLFEARPCPLGIPSPNDITLTQPQAAEDARATDGVAYADDEHGHFGLVEVGGRKGRAWLELALVREDGATPYRRRFERSV